MNNKIDLVSKLLTAAKGVSFASFTYRSKGTGELARHTVLLNASLENAYRADLARFEEMLPTLTEDLEIEACNQIIKSIKNSLEKGIGNNDNYTQKDQWIQPFEGISIAIDKEKGTIQVRGRSVQKKVLEAGVYKEVKSRPLTLAKKKLEKGSKRNSIRSFCLSEFTAAKIDGDTLIFE